MLPFLFAILPQPIDLDRISLERARAMHGRVVVATFLVAKPTYTWRNRTILGAADRDDGAERTAMLRGKRLDIDEGQRVNVVGTLRVIDHGHATVGGEFVPGWTELRVEG